MCWLARVSRAGYYRNLAERHPDEEEIEVRSAIQEIALAHPRRYGYRRLAVELRRRGFKVNHKRLSRLMREDNLLAIRQRRFVLTTDAQHELEVCLNLAKRMQLNAANQLWIADLTSGSDRSAESYRCTATGTGSGASFRPGHSIRFGRVYGGPE